MSRDVVNKFGLSRYIPADIRRELRQRCGFGCVVCGLAFYDYEHFNPEFVDARTHDPKGMTLLCSQCNQKRARGRLSAETVARHNASPKCLQDGYASEIFDFGTSELEVRFGGISFLDVKHLIVINGVPLVSMAPPASPGEPMRLTARLTDRRGKPTLLVADNVFKVRSDSWDVECVGPTVTFRNALGDIALAFTLRPPHGIDIERLNMVFKGVYLRGSKDLLEFSFNGRSWITFSSTRMAHQLTGVRLENGPPSLAANDGFYQGL